jgi:hypothetical protein
MALFLISAEIIRNQQRPPDTARKTAREATSCPFVHLIGGLLIETHQFWTEIEAKQA